MQYSVTQQCNQNKIGKIYKVIVDEANDGTYIGRSYLDSPEIDSGIIFTSKEQITIGSFVNVKIISFDGYDLIGECV